MFSNFRAKAASKADPRAETSAAPGAVLLDAHERMGIKGVLHEVLLAARTGLAGSRTEVFGKKTREDTDLLKAFSRTLDVHGGVFRAVMDKHGDVGALANLRGKINAEEVPRTIVSDAPLGLQMTALLERGARGLQLMSREAKSEAEERTVQRVAGSLALAQTFWARHGVEVAMGVTAAVQAKGRAVEAEPALEREDDYEFAPR